MVLLPATTACGAARLTVVIHGAKDANDSRSCYVLVRTIEDKPTSANSYAQSVELAKNPDDSVKATVILLPRQTRSIEVSPPAKGQLVIEVLLEKPEPSAWRAYVPSGTSQIELNVMKNKICVVQPKTAQTCGG